MAEQRWTILSLLTWTTDYLTKHGVETPRLDAEVLLAYLLKLDRVQLYMQFERPMSAEELAAYKSFLQRRVKGEPVSYIRGQKEFWSLTFKVGPGVLVPRPDTEVLIENVISRIPKAREAFRALDIGTGSGILAVILAKEYPQAHVTAVDFSETALEYARTNAQTHGFGERITFLKADFMKEDLEGSFDLIVSNPPYVAKKEIEELPSGIRDYEPLTALDGGADGLDFYRRIGQGVAHLLKPEGLLVVEIGEEQGNAVSALFAEAGLNKIEILKDYAGHPRVVVAVKN